MSKFEDLEAMLRDATDQAVQSGFLIVKGDWAVCWSVSHGCWIWDSTVARAPACCFVGAYLLVTETDSSDEPVHKGDPYQAAMRALDLDKWELRDLLNGCDTVPMHRGHAEEPYNLGLRLASTYRPVDIELLAPPIPKESEVRLRDLAQKRKLG